MSSMYGAYCSNHRRDFVILVGQPGSGKSTTVYKFLKDELKLKCTLPSSCTTVHFASVDSFVENDPDYQVRVKQMENTTRNKVDELTNPAQITELATNLNNIYLDVRNAKGYSHANEVLLQENVLKRMNIVFEITGLNPDTWKKLCNDQLDVGRLLLQQRGYRVTVVFAYTAHTVIKHRLLGRFKDGGRLTPLESLAENEKTLVENITSLLQRNRSCIDRLVIYDNTDDKSAPRIILDTKLSSGSTVGPLGTPEGLQSIWETMYPTSRQITSRRSGPKN